MNKLHDTPLTPEAIEKHDRERQRVNDSIEVFARQFATDCGEPIPDNWYYDEWELYAGFIRARFSYSDQSGGENRSVRFPIGAITDPAVRQAEVDAIVLAVQAKHAKERERQMVADRAELVRITARLAGA